MKVIGQFRDLDDPNRFVWLRGFRNMPTRAQALGVFYTSDVWMQNRDAVNETLVADPISHTINLESGVRLGEIKLVLEVRFNRPGNYAYRAWPTGSA